MNIINCAIRIKTESLVSVSSTSVLTGGSDILSPDPVLEKGVVWDISPDPTISSQGKKVAGAGRTDFESVLEGLVPGQTYFIRAYALNKDGINYGEQRIISIDSPTGTGGACTIYSNVIMPGTAYIIPAGAEVVSVTNKDFLFSSCGQELVADPIKCYGVYFCISEDSGGGTNHYSHVSLQGLMVDGVKVPFYNQIDFEPPGSFFEEKMDDLVEAIKSMTLSIQGIISGTTRCTINADDETGYCGALTIRTTSTIAKDLRLYGYFGPLGNEIDDDTMQVQYPFLSKQDMYDQSNIELCACNDEPLT
jgi:hypothetical protein